MNLALLFVRSQRDLSERFAPAVRGVADGTESADLGTQRDKAQADLNKMIEDLTFDATI